MLKRFFLLLTILSTQLTMANSDQGLAISSFQEQMFFREGKPLPIQLLQKIKFRLAQKEKNKVTAALLALPLPLGFVGAHRLYLGTKPHVPIVYVVTAGGCFGILPFVDMVVILVNDSLESYADNPKVFMWGN